MNAEWIAAISAMSLAAIALVRQVWLKTLAHRAAREIADRAREAADREAEDRRWQAVVMTQREFVMELHNHMSDDREMLQKISEHMGATVEALRGMQIALVSKKK